MKKVGYKTYCAVVSASEVSEPVLEDLVSCPLAALVLGMPLGTVRASDVIQCHQTALVDVHLLKRLINHVTSALR